ncbi:MAG TPA: hypothetical protein VF658_22185 [Pyrinomonadaceae bacterium]|jgi:hypothetical protein
MKQNPLTVIVPIKPEAVGALRDVLAKINEELKSGANVWFRRSPSTHFARWVILDNNKQRPLQLYFSCNYDGDLDDYLGELVDKLPPEMDEVWNKCEGYTPLGSLDAQSRKKKFAAFIKSYKLRAQAFYAACAGASVEDILTAAKIRQSIDRVLDCQEIRPAFEEVYKLLPDFSPAPLPLTPSRPDIRAKKKDARPPHFSWLARLIEWVIGVKLGVKNPNKLINTPNDLASIEDLMVQNQMTVITKVKRWRLLFLRGVLWGANIGAKGTKGALGDIATIHFCRWVIINDGKDMLFESNYDGSWENYIDDFGDSASLEMDAMWSNCEGFPTGGSLDIDWFKAYIRDNQLPAQVFYSAYPDSTVQNILNDLRISRLVQTFMAQVSAKRFLSGSYILTGLGSPTWKRWKKLTRVR